MNTLKNREYIEEIINHVDYILTENTKNMIDEKCKDYKDKLITRKSAQFQSLVSQTEPPLAAPASPDVSPASTAPAAPPDTRSLYNRSKNTTRNATNYLSSALGLETKSSINKLLDKLDKKHIDQNDSINAIIEKAQQNAETIDIFDTSSGTSLGVSEKTLLESLKDPIKDLLAKIQEAYKTKLELNKQKLSINSDYTEENYLEENARKKNEERKKMVLVLWEGVNGTNKSFKSYFKNLAKYYKIVKGYELYSVNSEEQQKEFDKFNRIHEAAIKEKRKTESKLASTRKNSLMSTNRTSKNYNSFVKSDKLATLRVESSLADLRFIQTLITAQRTLDAFVLCFDKEYQTEDAETRQRADTQRTFRKNNEIAIVLEKQKQGKVLTLQEQSLIEKVRKARTDQQLKLNAPENALIEKRLAKTDAALQKKKENTEAAQAKAAAEKRGFNSVAEANAQNAALDAAAAAAIEAAVARAAAEATPKEKAAAEAAAKAKEAAASQLRQSIEQQERSKAAEATAAVARAAAEATPKAKAAAEAAAKATAAATRAAAEATPEAEAARLAAAKAAEAARLAAEATPEAEAARLAAQAKAAAEVKAAAQAKAAAAEQLINKKKKSNANRIESVKALMKNPIKRARETIAKRKLESAAATLISAKFRGSVARRNFTKKN